VGGAGLSQCVEDGCTCISQVTLAYMFFFACLYMPTQSDFLLINIACIQCLYGQH